MNYLIFTIPYKYDSSEKPHEHLDFYHSSTNFRNIISTSYTCVNKSFIKQNLWNLNFNWGTQTPPNSEFPCHTSMVHSTICNPRPWTNTSNTEGAKGLKVKGRRRRRGSWTSIAHIHVIGHWTEGWSRSRNTTVLPDRPHASLIPTR